MRRRPGQPEPPPRALHARDVKHQCPRCEASVPQLDPAMSEAVRTVLQLVTAAAR